MSELPADRDLRAIAPHLALSASGAGDIQRAGTSRAPREIFLWGSFNRRATSRDRTGDRPLTRRMLCR